MDDLTTELERSLGKLVKQKYDTDFYIIYRWVGGWVCARAWVAH